MTMAVPTSSYLPKFGDRLTNSVAPSRKPINGMIFGVWDILGTNCMVGYR